MSKSEGVVARYRVVSWLGNTGEKKLGGKKKEEKTGGNLQAFVQ